MKRSPVGSAVLAGVMVCACTQPGSVDPIRDGSVDGGDGGIDGGIGGVVDITGWPTPFAEPLTFLADEIACYRVHLDRAGTLESFGIHAPVEAGPQASMYAMALYASGDQPQALLAATAAATLLAGMNSGVPDRQVAVEAGDPWICLRLDSPTALGIDRSGPTSPRCDSSGPAGFDVPWPSTFTPACGSFFPTNLWIATRWP